MSIFSSMEENSDSVTNITDAATSKEEITKNKKHKDSGIWQFFEKVKNGGTYTGQSKCLHCESLYAHKSTNGTSTLWNHLKICKKYPRNNLKKQNLLCFQKDVQGSDVQLVNWNFDQELFRKALARMIIIDELPFKFVEHEGFKHFMIVVQPKFKLVSRITVARDCLELYANEKKKLKKILSSCESMSLTTDIGTSIQNMSYMCLTAHFIDNNWKLHKRIINFCIIQSHKGVAIGQAIETCLLQWGIKKVASITVDNASSKDTAVAYLKKKLGRKNGFVLLKDGNYFHVRCCAHILNLIVRDGVEEVKDSISRISGVVRYIGSSPQRAMQFKSCCEEERITSESALCLDVPTRWNSTYAMLDCALKFQKTFERLGEQETQLGIDLSNGFPVENNWDVARVLVKFLKAFFNVTKRLSGSLYVASNMYFDEVSTIEDTLNDWCRDKDKKLKEMAEKMKIKFDKYWRSIEKRNMILLVALVLDPRYKLCYVKFTYESIYLPKKLEELVKKVGEVLNLLYIEYQSLNFASFSHSSNMESQETQSMDMDEMDGNEHYSRLNNKKARFTKKLTEEKNLNSKSELDIYLLEGIHDGKGNFDVLEWWKMNSGRYPILSQIARNVLAIPVSTVASESAFSTGGRVLDQFRSSLTPKVMKCLICTQDWIRASRLPIDVVEKLEELDSVLLDEINDIASA